MKRILTFAACAAAVLASISCEKTETKPTVEFSEKITSINIGGTVEVSAVLDKAAEAAVTVPVDFSGPAVKGTAYTVSSEAFVFAAGETKASITITDVELKSEEQIVMKLTGSEAIIGTNYICVVARELGEKLVYNFDRSVAEFVEKTSFTVSVAGVETGKDYVADTDIEIPVKIEGSIAAAVECPTTVVILKGTNTAAIEVKKVSGGEAGSATISLDGERFIAGEKGSVTLNMVNPLTPEDLVGTWSFNRVYDLEELELWFMEYEDDPDLLPTHNEGFELTFYEEDGAVKVKVGGEGDFANYFRDGATVSNAEPINYSSEGIQDGKYSVLEVNMFHAEEMTPAHQVIWTYFNLSSANRAFSADDEILGESIIAFRINGDGALEMQFRDYDTPPFGEMWWDDDFEPDMFSFCSVFDPVK